MNVGPTLPAIRRLNRLRLPLKVVTVGTSNFDPRFSSHLELLTGADQLHTTSGASQQILQRKGLRLEEWTASFFSSSSRRNLPLSGLSLDFSQIFDFVRSPPVAGRLGSGLPRRKLSRLTPIRRPPDGKTASRPGGLRCVGEASSLCPLLKKAKRGRFAYLTSGQGRTGGPF
jgi:hypothetical protein